MEENNRLKLTGKIVKILPPKTVVSSKGTWISQDYLLDVQDKFSREVLFNVFGQEKIDKFAISLGEIVEVSFNIETKEFNNKYYTSVSAWFVKKISGGSNNNNNQQTSMGTSHVEGVDNAVDVNSLPF